MISPTDTPFFKRLTALYARMDEAWKTAAAHYGFVCRGCPENCCETEFYHHTHIERNYLLSGLATLALPMVETIQAKAVDVCKARAATEVTGEPLRVMCPLNSDGLCQLYRFRPMICRLHGIPHELTRPGVIPSRQPGCRAGGHLFDSASYHQFDRTPFYTEMAQIEMDYRRATNNQTRLKLTIAEMVLPR